MRFLATAVAGGALAAVGQHALAQRLPDAADGSNVLRLGMQEFLGSGDHPAAPVSAPATAVVPSAVTEPRVTLAPVPTVSDTPETGVAEASELVKAADLQRKAIEAAEQTGVAEANAAAQAATRAALDKAVQGAKTAAAERAEQYAAESSTPKDAAKKGPAEKGPAETGPAEKGPAENGTAKGRADTSSLAGGAVQMITGRVTSGFGSRWGTRHQGLDIAAPIGTPIRVPLAGTVIDSGPASGFGLWVRVRHTDGTITTYGHINRSLVGKGQRVEPGQKIAEVGNRGQSTGPHLHIEVTTPGGVKINPRPWLDRHRIGY